VRQGPKGIIAGQFIQPIFNFIFPELITLGGQQVPNQFDVIPFLAQGSGPLELGNLLSAPLPSPPIVGQLSPWPGSVPPSTTVCPPPSTASASASASKSASASATPSGTPKDIITILSATARNQKGQTTTTVTASSSNPLAQLFLAITGVDNVAAQPMTKISPGQFSLAISTKGKPSSVTVTSSLGGNPVTQAV
jgi:hypothetical protein